MIKREEYFNKLIDFKDSHIIKVVTGIRRCGKSTLLEMYRDYLLDSGVTKDQIIFINFEDLQYFELDTPIKVYQYISERLDKDKRNYIFLDEVQSVPDFQKAVDSLFINKNNDVYITGSNAYCLLLIAYMLSGEIATLLSGRYIEIKMLPLSFKEYVSAMGTDGGLAEKYADYLVQSSFPYTLELNGDMSKISDYLMGIYNTVLLKDVVARKHTSDVMMLESIIRFLFDNIGNLLSTKKIADTMTSAGRKISNHKVEQYLTAFLDSFILYRAKRYDIKGKQYLKTNDKYYVCDMGLRYILLGMKNQDVGFILENVIYLELLRRGYDVYVGKLDNTEVDFVAVKDGYLEYYQIAATVREQSTLDRELAPLNMIQDHYPKYLLTLDEDPVTDYNGIRKINALKFLMGMEK